MAWVQLVVAVVMLVVSYAITPKPKQQKPAAAQQGDNPTAEAGIEMPVLFGTATMQAPNCLWFGEKGMKTYQVDA